MSLTLTQFYAEQQGQELQQQIAKVVEKYSKVVPMLPVKTLTGLIHKYPKETSLGGVGKRTINQAPPAVAGGSTSPVEEAVAILTRKVTTDYRMVAADQSSRGNEISRATRAIAREMDDQIFNGDRQTDNLNLLGLRYRCAGNQLVSAGTNGAQLTLAMIDSLIDTVVEQGNGRHLFLNKKLSRKFKNLVIASAGGAAVADITAEIPKYEDVQLHVLGDGVDNLPILHFNETQGSSNVAASIYCLAPGNDDIDLSGIKLLAASNSIEVLAEGMRDAQVIDLVEVAFGLAVYDDTSVARLSGVLAPA